MTQSDLDDHAADIARIDRLARLLDSRYRLFGIRFGLDSIVGLVPGIGDFLVAAPSAWMIWKAHRSGVPGTTLAKMAGNTAVDFALGSVPVVGDILDIGFKANLRNAQLLRDGLVAKRGAMPTDHRRA